MDPFNLIYLKYFIDSAESNSVSEAARKNFVTQSCVSQGIKKLEQTLKIDLTMHLRNRFKLTEEGEIVLVIGGATQEKDLEQEKLDQLLTRLLQDLSVKAASQLAADLTGIKKKVAYQRALELTNKD